MTKAFKASILLALPLLFFLTACSESDDTEQEFDNWQAKNEAYFDELYNSVKKGQRGDDWKVFRCWAMPDESSLGYEESAKDCIVVNILENGEGEASPLYTDSVRCHYEGRLLPSLSYKDGYKFDSSFDAPFNADYAVPVKFLNSGLVLGFTTALMNMHSGDHWRVYIPHQLGYGDSSSSSTSIPAYSTLIFDIRLVDFWRPYYSE